MGQSNIESTLVYLDRDKHILEEAAFTHSISFLCWLTTFMNKAHLKYFYLELILAEITFKAADESFNNACTYELSFLEVSPPVSCQTNMYSLLVEKNHPDRSKSSNQEQH